MGFNTLFKKAPIDKEVEDRYEVGKKLGTGNFAVVYAVKEKASGRDYALKIISKKRVQDKEYMVQSEIDVMKKLAHPNIVTLVDVIDTKKNINVVTDLASGGDLFEHVTSKGKLSEEEAKKFLRQILTALDYVHSLSIVHRDIKPENILLNNPTEKKIILIDFGLAVPMKDGKLLREACGSPEYVAPEQLRPQHQGYGTKADLWSVGVVAYIMLSGYHPFSASNEEDRSYLIRNGVYEFHEEKWNTVSAAGKAFVKKLIEIDIEERMDCKAALAHPWLTSAADLQRAEEQKVREKQEAEEKEKAKAEEPTPTLPLRSTSLAPKTPEIVTPATSSSSPKPSPVPSPTPSPRHSLAPSPKPVETPKEIPKSTESLLEDLEAWKELDDLENASKIISLEEADRMEKEEKAKQAMYQKERDRIATEEANKRAEEEEASRKAKEEEDRKNVHLNAKKQQEIDDAFSELEDTMKGL